MKFIADFTLGRLARWLRILGQDTIFYNKLDKDMLIRIGKEKGRIILTKDTKLIKRRDIGDHLFITSNRIYDQVKEVVNHYRLGCEDTLFTRCIICNTELIYIERGEIKGMVPDFVFNSKDRFYECHNCKRIFWEGTHKEKMKRKIEEILSPLTS